MRHQRRYNVARVRSYNEEDAFVWTYKFLDTGGLPSIPTTARYRIECLTTQRMMRDWTEITPASEVEIIITSSDNAINNNRNSTERRLIIIQSNYDTDTQKSTTDEWVVRNLQGVT